MPPHLTAWVWKHTNAAQIMQVLAGPPGISHYSVPSTSGPLVKSGLHNPAMRGSASLHSLLSGGVAPGVPTLPAAELQQTAVEMEAVVGQARTMLSSLDPREGAGSDPAGGHPLFSRTSHTTAFGPAGGSQDDPQPQLSSQHSNMQQPQYQHQQLQYDQGNLAPLPGQGPATIPASPLPASATQPAQGFFPATAFSRQSAPMPPSDGVPSAGAVATDQAPQQFPPLSPPGSNLPRISSTPVLAHQQHISAPHASPVNTASHQTQHHLHLTQQHVSNHLVATTADPAVPPGQALHRPPGHTASSSSLGSVLSPASQPGQKVCE
jgi:hypothetical protein